MDTLAEDSTEDHLEGLESDESNMNMAPNIIERRNIRSFIDFHL